MPTRTPTADTAAALKDLPGPDRYLAFYGLAAPPFSAGTDPARLWLAPAHRVVLDTLGQAVRDGHGIALLTGDAGTGKTSLASRLLASLPGRFAVGRVSSPGTSPADLWDAVLSAFGMRDFPGGRDAFAARWQAILARAAADGAKMLLVIDEAQALGPDMLGDVGWLVSVATSGGHPLVVLLVGETRLGTALADPRHAALVERILARCAVPPLGIDEVATYVRHRLDTAGATTAVFDDEAVRQIAILSRGAPGSINIIADRALLAGRSRRVRPITPAIVRQCWRTAVSPRVPSLPPAARNGRERGKHSRRHVYVTAAATVLLVTGAPYLVWWLTGLGGAPARTASRELAPDPARQATDAERGAASPPASDDAPHTSVPAVGADETAPALPGSPPRLSPTPLAAHAAGQRPGEPGGTLLAPRAGRAAPGRALLESSAPAGSVAPVDAPGAPPRHAAIAQHAASGASTVVPPRAVAPAPVAMPPASSGAPAAASPPPEPTPRAAVAQSPATSAPPAGFGASGQPPASGQAGTPHPALDPRPTGIAPRLAVTTPPPAITPPQPAVAAPRPIAPPQPIATSPSGTPAVGTPPPPLAAPQPAVAPQPIAAPRPAPAPPAPTPAASASVAPRATPPSAATAPASAEPAARGGAGDGQPARGRASERGGESPDPSAIIEWLMKGPSGKR